MSCERDSDGMTAAQRDAKQKAWDLLSEHFERVLLVIDWDIDHEDGRREDAHAIYWHGGALAAIGAASFARHRILHSGKKANEPEE